MEKQKVNVLIKGDLVCKNELRGGQIYTCSSRHLNDCFDYENALVIDGNVSVDGFDGKGLCVVVTGGIVTEGGSHGSL